MKFLLTALKLFYVLDPNLMPFPPASDEDTDEIKAQRKKREEDELICRGYILNTLSDRLYDLYTSMKEIWNVLEAKYKTEKIDLTLEQFGQHLRIEEDSWVRDVTNTDSKVNVNNVSNVQSGSSSKTNKHLKVNKSGSGFKKNNSKNPKKDKKNRACFLCGKKSHYIRECRLLKNKKKDEEGNTIETNVVEDIVAMISGIHIDMITEVHMVVIANPFDWWFDSDATVHVCDNKKQYKSYDKSSIEQQMLMGNHNKAKVLGKGTVVVKMSSDKMMILTNVFHVPNIKKNLVSANLLCKNGVKAVLESDKLILSKNEIL
ncbi:hypothetical protein ACJW30_10G157300 [Castanea mollissima]